MDRGFWQFRSRTRSVPPPHTSDPGGLVAISIPTATVIAA